MAKILRLLLILTCAFAWSSWGDVVCVGTSASCTAAGSGTADPLSLTSITGTTNCGGAAATVANSVCLSANTITGEGATADAFETLFSFADPTADGTLTFTSTSAGVGVTGFGTLTAGGVDTEATTQTCAGWGLAAPVGAWSCAGSTITRTASAADLTITNNAVTATQLYKTLLTLATVTAGSFSISVGGVAGTTRSAAGVYTEWLTTTATTAVTITAVAASAGTITTTGVSARPVVDALVSPAGDALRTIATAPAAPANYATPGSPVYIRASDAVANTGAGTDGAAEGGSVTVASGSAKRDTSGNANAGNINLAGGAGIGTGTAGSVVVTGLGLALPDGSVSAPAMRFSSDADTGWYTLSSQRMALAQNGAIGAIFNTFGLSVNNIQLSPTSFSTNTLQLRYSAAGVAQLTDSLGRGGDLIVGSGLLTAATMTAGQVAYSSTVTSSYTWTNAQVAALGAFLVGDITVATLPAKTQVLDAAIVITGQAAGTTTLTVSCGDAIGATPFINYIVPSNAKAAANTVYGDAVGERGTSLDVEHYYLPSYTATTLVTCHFTSTIENLSAVTGSTGTVILTTRLLP